MDAATAPWRAEPFRVFFPLAVVLGWVGIGHWLLYGIGATSTFSCQLHGLVQVQGFLMAFAVGFLFTAIPRRTQTAVPSRAEMTAAIAALVLTTTGAVMEEWRLAEAAYVTIFLVLLRFAGRRFLGRAAGRRPPAAFVLIPIGIVQGVVGAVAIAVATHPRTPAWCGPLGRLLVEQGVFLSFVVGVGSLVLPLMSGGTPPADLGSSPREWWRLAIYALAGLGIAGSLVAEQAGWTMLAPLMRAAIVAAALAAAGAARRPGKPGLHRWLVWLAAWLTPAGLAASALLPDFRIAALHVLFIGGFGLLAFGVATHVALTHLDLTALATGRPPAVAVLGAALMLALVTRIAADWSETYFEHLGWAAGLWLAGTAVWLGFLGPLLLARRR